MVTNRRKPRVLAKYRDVGFIIRKDKGRAKWLSIHSVKIKDRTITCSSRNEVTRKNSAVQDMRQTVLKS